MHAKFERLLSKSLTTLEVMAYYRVVHSGPGPHCLRDLVEQPLYSPFLLLPFQDRLVGLVVKASASRQEDPGKLRDFSGLSHTRDLKIGTPVATLAGAWRYRVSWHWSACVSIL